MYAEYCVKVFGPYSDGGLATLKSEQHTWSIEEAFDLAYAAIKQKPDMEVYVQRWGKELAMISTDEAGKLCEAAPDTSQLPPDYDHWTREDLLNPAWYTAPPVDTPPAA
jgi:hypothetical protein